MEQLTSKERSTIERYLARPPRGRLDYFSSFAVYIVPSFLSALYGLSKGDFLAVGLAYLVLLVAIAYIIGYQSRTSGLFYSAIKKLAEKGDGTAAVADSATAD